MKFTIGTKLIASFCFLFVLATLFGLYAFTVTQKTIQEAVGQTSIFLAEDQMEKVDKDIFLKIVGIQLYSRDTLVQKALAESNRVFEQLESTSTLKGGIELYLRQKDLEWTSAPKDSVTPFMEELITNEVADTLREEFIGFLERKYGSIVYGEAFITNKYGANIAQTGKTSDYYQADETWWQIAKEKGFSVGDIEYDESAGIWTMPFGVRIDDRNGNFLGVIKAIPNVREIIREVELTSRKYETTEVKLLTQKGELIYSTRAFQMLENVSETLFFQKAQGADPGFFVAEEGGREKLFAYARSRGFRNFEGAQWTFLIGHDTAEVFAAVGQLRTTFVTISTVLLLLIGVMAIIFTRTITKPIRKLTDGANYIAKGNLDVKIDIQSKDEIGQLAASFNAMAARLKKSHENLEKNVEQRTAELQQRVHELDTAGKLLIGRDVELSQAREELQDRLKELDGIAKRLVRRDFELLQANETFREMDQAKSRFVSIAAHQLRTPISAVKWSVEMLLSGDFGELPTPSKEALGKVKDSIERLVKLIGDLLDVARIEEGRFVYNFSAHQIEDICKEVFNASLPDAKERGVSLTISLPPKLLPPIHADLGNLILVLQNIVDNALSYTPRKGSVKIIVEKNARDLGRVRVSVQDTGMGIPDLQKALIGQKFFRGDNVVREQIEGTGLGLYIVSRILEKHGSRLEFESEEDKGSTFSFALPFAQR